MIQLSWLCYLWFMSYGALYMVLHLHIMVDLFHVLLKTVSQSDTESGVHFDLAITVQKLAYRRVRMSFLCAAIPMVEGLMDFPIVPISLLWQRMAQLFLIVVIMCMC